MMNSTVASPRPDFLPDFLKASPPMRARIGGAPEGMDVLALSTWTRTLGPMVLVLSDDKECTRYHAMIRSMAKDVAVRHFPAWDCLPYDRVSPSAYIISQRLATLHHLMATAGTRAQKPEPEIILTTVSAILQRTCPRAALKARIIAVKKGTRLDADALLQALYDNGYSRTDMVVEAGTVARRGSIIDIFPNGADNPYRLDFFGDELDDIRLFDAASQRTIKKTAGFRILPGSECFLDTQSIERFCEQYRQVFGVSGRDDPLFQAISEGRRHAGMEHWLPLFHSTTETLLDYTGTVPVLLTHHCQEAMTSRLSLIDDYYDARKFANRTGSDNTVIGTATLPYQPIAPDTLYLDASAWQDAIAHHGGGVLQPYAIDEEVQHSTQGMVHNLGGRPVMDFAEARARGEGAHLDEFITTVGEHLRANRRVVLSLLSAGTRARALKMLDAKGMKNVCSIESWDDIPDASRHTLALMVGAAERGFLCDELALYTEQDLFGERMKRRKTARARPEDLIHDTATLNKGDFVVHQEHGIARFDGLETIHAGGAAHDCLLLMYADNARLYLPVENIDLVTRYGGDSSVTLDRLGGASWQARKARLKERLREMTDELMQTAARRALQNGVRMTPPKGAWEEFCARFPYEETDDQHSAIADVLEDFEQGRNSDRLICGDVGFGKTEIALRAAFVCAMEGRQVIVVAPTTLLCRQHFHLFQERFKGFPVRIAQLSRLATARAAKETKAGLKDGSVDIVIGTHALLSKHLSFARAGLLIIDEEQHFGVAHKERLKNLRADMHVITLTATPIPRTLQLALSGVRDLSLIATPPVDRLAVRTFVMPFDPVMVREAIRREYYRGGQVFFVCPHIKDLGRISQILAELVPDISFRTVHGQMPGRVLEETIEDFNNGVFHLLVATNIIESGLDMPRVNTIIIWRADRFGLAQLYQLRGRVGRGNARAWAYLTIPHDKTLSKMAEKRLQVMQTLDHLGAGFTLASHDMDIRGAGNLLGEEQSGHVREVGIELYMQMLEEAVAAAGVRQPATDETTDVSASMQHASPEIKIGTSVMIAADWIEDLNVRMELYKRIAALSDVQEVEACAAEMIDRFGPLPDTVENLLEVVKIKSLCRIAHVSHVDAGPKGAVLRFYDDAFPNPTGLIEMMQQNEGIMRLKPDHKLVYLQSWDDVQTRMRGTMHLLQVLSTIATR